MSKVFPAQETFPAVHGTTLTSLDEDYLAAKERVGEHFITLPDKRKICYMKDGDPDDVLVLCFHGGCEGKYKFIQKQPIPGLFLVSIDRPGYGNSDPAPPGYCFEDVAEDVRHLAKTLGFDGFIVSGHSIGGGWAQQIAAALPHQVRGVILWSAVVDLSHPKATPAIIKAVGRPPGCLHPTKGCCGCILSSQFRSYAKTAQKYDFKSNLSEEMKCPAGFDKYKADPFWISATVDSYRAFKPPAEGILLDAQMVLFAGSKGKPVGHYDVGTIKCPMYIVHGSKDFDMGTKAPAAIEYMKMLYPSATFDIMEGYGHVCTVGPNPETQERFQKAVARMPALPITLAPTQQEMT